MISMIDFTNKKMIFKLKQSDEFSDKVKDLLIKDESILDSYKSLRDGVVFTDKRIITINVQGLTGTKIDYTSIPYSKIQTYSVETAGLMDVDSELEIYVASVGKLSFEFKAKSKIVEISKKISEHIL